MGARKMGTFFQLGAPPYMFICSAPPAEVREVGRHCAVGKAVSLLKPEARCDSSLRDRQGKGGGARWQVHRYSQEKNDRAVFGGASNFLPSLWRRWPIPGRCLLSRMPPFEQGKRTVAILCDAGGGMRTPA